MSAISRTIDDIVKRQLAPALKERGYRRQRRDFWRTLNDAILVVNIQGGKANYGSSGYFFVNLGKHFPALDIQVLAHPRPQRPKEYDCQFRTRLNHLAPHKYGPTWEVGEASDPDAIAHELAAAIVEVGLPWLEGATTHTAVAQECEKTRPLFAAAAYFACDNRADALRVVHSYVADNPEKRSEVSAWIAKFGQTVVA